VTIKSVTVKSIAIQIKLFIL